MTEDNVPFYDLPLKAYPFRIIGYDVDTLKTVFTILVNGPGAVHIPAKPEDVREVGIRVEWGDGSTTDTELDD